MNDLNKFQREINHLAYTAFKKGCKGLSKQYLEKFSIPIIPRITQEYLEYRLVILGQETATWYPESWYKNEDKNDPLYKSYKEFNLYDLYKCQGI